MPGPDARMSYFSFEASLHLRSYSSFEASLHLKSKEFHALYVQPGSPINDDAGAAGAVGLGMVTCWGRATLLSRFTK